MHDDHVSRSPDVAESLDWASFAIGDQRGDSPAATTAATPHRTPLRSTSVARWLTENDSLAGLPALPPPGVGVTKTPLVGALTHAPMASFAPRQWASTPERHPASFATHTSWVPRRLPPPAEMALTPTMPQHEQPPEQPPERPRDDLRRVARGDRAILTAMLLCVALLLGTAGSVFATSDIGASWLSAVGVPFGLMHSPQRATANATAPTSPSPAPTIAPTLAPTPLPTATLAPTQVPTAVPTKVPTPAPAHTPAPVRPAPTAAIPAAVPSALAPTVSTLSVTCAAPGASLPLRNTSDATQSFTITVPAGIVVNGWTGLVRGSVGAHQTLVLGVWRTTGTQVGAASLRVATASQVSTVRLFYGAC